MLLLVASALLASAEPAATSPAPATAPAATPAPTAKPKRICRMEEALTGSITPRRVCVTVPQDAPTASKPAQDAARDKQPQAASTASGTSN